MEIVNLSSKVDSLFKKIDANPADYKDDLELIYLMEKLGSLVDKYRKTV